MAGAVSSSRSAEPAVPQDLRAGAADGVSRQAGTRRRQPATGTGDLGNRRAPGAAGLPPRAARLPDAMGATAGVADPAAVARGGQRPLMHPLLSLGIKAYKLAVAALALSGGYRLVRNPGDFVAAPMHTLMGFTTFSERLDEHTLPAARQAVLDRFGEYIPADSTCHQTPARLSFEMDLGVGGGYLDHSFAAGPALLLNPYQQLGGGLHVAVHEFCHCYTHPRFYEAIKASPNERELGEALTEHLADKFPTGSLSKLSFYDRQTLSNGKKLSQAARELEEKVGEPTLLRAYFKGDAAAIRKLSRAAVDVMPKEANAVAWNFIHSVGKLRGSQQLAECFVGASMLHERKLPDSYSASKPKGSHAGRYLPVGRFSDIRPEQAQRMKEQAEQARERLGPSKFDQAFYSLDTQVLAQSMRSLREDLVMHWKPVLSW